MPLPVVSDFLSNLETSGLVDTTKLSKWKTKIGDSAATSQDLAKDLIRRKWLTLWQAKMLLSGSTSFKLGSYTLTERVDRTEMGDRYHAVHQQLSRDVSIQHLPLSRCDAASKEIIYEHGRKLANLDHPNLVHVYDIDEENDRVYLVSEASCGKSIADSRSGRQLPAESMQVANLIQQLLSAVRYANGLGVVHGGINSSNVIIADSGKVKLRGLTRDSVHNALNRDSACTPEKDIQAVKKIGIELLASLNPAPASDLVAICNSISGDGAAGLQSLEQWIFDHTEPELDDTVEAVIACEEIYTAPHHVPVESASAVAAKSAPKSRQKETEEESGNFIVNLARKNPVAVLLSAAILCLVMVGGTVGGATVLLSGGSKAPEELASADKPRNVGDHKTRMKQALDPNANRKAIAALFGEEVPDDVPEEKASRKKKKSDSAQKDSSRKSSREKSKVTKDPAEDAQTVALVEKSSKERKKKSDGKKSTSKKKTDSKKTDSKEPESKEPEARKPESKKPEGEASEKKKEPEVKSLPEFVAAPPAKSQQKFLKPGADPFARYPASVDIPEATDTKKVSLGKLILEEKQLLAAELLSSPSVGKRSPVFSMKRSADDNQQWDISWNAKRGDPIVVAKLKKSPGDLTFQWLPAAAENPSANYLRNCRMKLFTTSKSHWMSLRKPFRIKGFKVGKDSLDVSVESEIPWLPSPGSITAQCSLIRMKVPPNSGRRPTLSPAEITKRSPARLYFSQNKSRYLWVEISASISKKVKLNANVFAQPNPNDRPQRMRTRADIAAMRGGLVQLMQATEQRSKSKGVSQQAKRELEKNVIQLKGLAESADYYHKISQNLVGIDIPVTVIYSLNNQHRIVLGTTSKDANVSLK